MLEYSHKNNCMDLKCNTCGQEMSFDGDFKYCVSEAKQAGWNIIKKPDGWHHYCCEECKNDQNNIST